MPTIVKIDYAAAITQIEIPADDARLRLTHFKIAVVTAGGAEVASVLLAKAALPLVRSVEAPLPPGVYEARMTEVSEDGSQQGTLTLTQPFTVSATVTYLTLDPAGTLTITFVPTPAPPSA